MMLAIAALAFGLLQPASTGVSAGVSAETFVRGLYLRETHETKADEEAFSGHRGAEGIYSPSLLRLIRRDIREAKGEIGKLDYDPICGCQDSKGLLVQILRLAAVDASNTKAFVTLQFSGGDKAEITLKLVLLPTGWRVDDVDGPKGFRSLRSLLETKS